MALEYLVFFKYTSGSFALVRGALFRLGSDQIGSDRRGLAMDTDNWKIDGCAPVLANDSKRADTEPRYHSIPSTILTVGPRSRLNYRCGPMDFLASARVRGLKWVGVGQLAFRVENPVAPQKILANKMQKKGSIFHRK